MSTLVAVLAAGMAAGDVPKGGDDGACTYNSLEGVWRLERVEDFTGVRPLWFRPCLYVFSGKRLLFKNPRSGEVVAAPWPTAVALDESRPPARMTLTIKDELEPGGILVQRAIYRVRGDTLMICWGPEGRCLPKEFTPDMETRTVLYTLQRVRPGK
jgi:uncharacterized protein (TIGR03067 family)